MTIQYPPGENDLSRYSSLMRRDMYPNPGVIGDYEIIMVGFERRVAFCVDRNSWIVSEPGDRVWGLEVYDPVTHQINSRWDPQPVPLDRQYVGAYRAVRAWRYVGSFVGVDDFSLRSLVMGYSWTKGENVARVPTLNNPVGFYGYVASDVMFGDIGSTQHTRIYGTVLMYGRIVRANLGARAEKVVIENLLGHNGHVPAFAKAYNVPLLDHKEFATQKMGIQEVPTQ